VNSESNTPIDELQPAISTVSTMRKQVKFGEPDGEFLPVFEPVFEEDPAVDVGVGLDVM